MLYLCATPIGNLGDITERVIETLKSVDVIAAEDTRQTIKLLNHFSIKKPMISYHEHNRYEMTPVLVDRMLAGEDIALVTDAGTPAISDPGEDLVRAARDAGVPVTSLPGATAFTTALTLSGMSARRFTFEGFLPQDKNEQKAVLERLRDTTLTTVFYEAPHRLVKTLKLLADAVGKGDDLSEPDEASVSAEHMDEKSSDDKLVRSGKKRRVTICKELTKKHEWSEKFDSLTESVNFFSEKEAPRGEFVIVIEGNDPSVLAEGERARWESVSIEEHMEFYMSDGLDKKEAMKRVASDRGVSRREIYNFLLKGKTDD